MNTYDAIMKRRTIRKFEQKPVQNGKLVTMVDCARMAATGANMQPLKFAILDDMADEIFPYTKWAGYLPDGAPKEGERPPAYIAILGDTSIKNSFEVEAGAAITNMMIEAIEMGLGTCWLGAIDRPNLKKLFKLDDKFEVLYLLAVGYPAQKSVDVSMNEGDVKYFVGKRGTINVPKRALDEVLIKN